jgi:chorismate-pyruvate lyase
VQSWAAGGVLSRTYRIVAGGRPLMLIDEKFPLQA